MGDSNLNWVVDIAKGLGWNVEIKEAEFITDLAYSVCASDRMVTISKGSLEGYEFHRFISGKDEKTFIKDLQGEIEQFDIRGEMELWLEELWIAYEIKDLDLSTYSEENGLWLNLRGEQYDLTHVYKDIVACKEMLQELYNSLQCENKQED